MTNEESSETTSRSAGVKLENALPQLNCPKCLVRLDQVEIYAIPIEKCPECQGIWLDAGELELIYQRERGKDSLFSKLIKRVLAPEK